MGGSVPFQGNDFCWVERDQDFRPQISLKKGSTPRMQRFVFLSTLV